MCICCEQWLWTKAVNVSWGESNEKNLLTRVLNKRYDQEMWTRYVDKNCEWKLLTKVVYKSSKQKLWTEVLEQSVEQKLLIRVVNKWFKGCISSHASQNLVHILYFRGRTYHMLEHMTCVLKASHIIDVLSASLKSTPGCGSYVLVLLDLVFDKQFFLLFYINIVHSTHFCSLTSQASRDGQEFWSQRKCTETLGLFLIL